MTAMCLCVSKLLRLLAKSYVAKMLISLEANRDNASDLLKIRIRIIFDGKNLLINNISK